MRKVIAGKRSHQFWQCPFFTCYNIPFTASSPSSSSHLFSAENENAFLPFDHFTEDVSVSNFVRGEKGLRGVPDGTCFPSCRNTSCTISTRRRQCLSDDPQRGYRWVQTFDWTIETTSKIARGDTQRRSHSSWDHKYDWAHVFNWSERQGRSKSSEALAWLKMSRMCETVRYGQYVRCCERSLVKESNIHLAWRRKSFSFSA